MCVGVEISYVILTPSLVIDESFCISDLIDEIYHYIEIRSMISWMVIMLLLILPKDIPTRPEGQNIVFCTPPQPH